MKFNPMAFINNLEYMFVGMVSILIVIGVIILITTLLNKLPDKKGKED